MRRLVALDLAGGDLFVEWLQRVWDRGDAVLPLDQRLPVDRRHDLAGRLGASSVVDSTGETPLDDGSPVEDGDALVVVTSGTSGSPKGVVLGREAVEASAQRTAEAIGQLETDHWLACLPLSHIGGLSVVTRSLITGVPVTVQPGFDAAEVRRAAEHCTLVSLVPTALRRIDPGAFRRILLGGGRPPADRPTNSIATYGMTETGSGVVYDGLALRDVELRIGSGEEILVRSPTNMRAYRDGTTSIDHDGWLHTDDVGSLDADGRLSVRGRRGDVINSGGEKVWPDSVEAVVSDLDPGSEHVVVGLDDEEWGQIVVLVTTSNDLELDAVRALVRERVAPYASPRRLIRVGSIPRNTNGKVVRRSVATMVGNP